MKRRMDNKNTGASARRTKKLRLAQPPAELSAAYGQTRLTLLDVDSFHVHAAWEVTPRDRAAAEKKYAGAFIWMLRFHDERAGTSFDIPIELDARSWYVELWAADKTYHAALGPCSTNGDFTAVCRSNTITTPPAATAPPQAPQWLTVTGALEQAQIVSAPQVEPSAVSSQPSAAVGGTEPVFASPVETTAQDFPLAAPPHVEVVTPVGNLGALEIPTEAAAALTEKSAEVAASAVEVAPTGSSEAVSSFSMGGGAEQAAIELEVNAEVVVYGRAQPGQTLRVNGRPVPVNDDGTFHVRWALPVAKP